MMDVRALANGVLEAQEYTGQRMDRLEAALLRLAEAQEYTGQRIDRLEAVLLRLAEAQERTEQQVGSLTTAQERTELRLDSLAEAQERTEQQLRSLAEAQKQTEQELRSLAEAQKQTEQRMDRLAEAQERTEQQMAQMTIAVAEMSRAVGRMEPRVARADGWQLEQRYVVRAPSYFGRSLRQVTVLWPGRLDQKLEEQLDATLSPDEKDEVLRLDAIIRGKAQPPAAQDEVYVALEASVTISQNDVECVQQRAALLRRLGARVVSVVAGEEIEPEAEEAAATNAVAILRNGKRQGWEQALAAA
jgi:hypothetical protein